MGPSCTCSLLQLSSGGDLKFSTDPPGGLVGLGEVADLRAFAVAGVAVMPLSTEIERLK